MSRSRLVFEKGDRLQVFVVDLLQQPLGFRLGDVVKRLCACVCRGEMDGELESWRMTGEI